LGLLDEKIVKRQNFITTTADKIFNWSRLSSLWMLFYGIACCGIEAMAAGGPRYDLERFGVVGRASPRQSDLMIIAGPVVKKMVPVIKTLYAQMPEPKYVLSMGSCAITGGVFQDSYFVVNGAHKIIPVDVFIPGCHPRAEGFMYAILKIQEHIRKDTFVKGRPGPLKEPMYVPESFSEKQKQELEDMKRVEDEIEKNKTKK